MKKCTKGKSCGATCIDPRERCELELGPLIQPALTKVKGVITSLKEKQQQQDVESWSDEKAANWLKNNQKTLEGANIKLEGGKDAMWVLGNEPGLTRRDISSQYDALAKRLLREGKISPNKVDEDLTKLIKEEPSLAVRYTRNSIETMKLLNKALREKRDLMADLSEDSPVWKMLGNGDMPFGFNVKEQQDQSRFSKQSFWGKAFALANQVGAKSVSGTNMSMLHSNNEKIWPYGEVFKKAGMDPGVFKTRSSWLRHLANGPRSAAIANQVFEKKPGKVYLSGANGEGVLKALEKQAGAKAKEVNVPWVSKNGKKSVSRFKVLKVGDTNVVFGPHFTAQTPAVVNEKRKELLKGE